MTRIGSGRLGLGLVAALGVTACQAPPEANLPPVMFRGDAEHSGVFRSSGVPVLGGVVWRFRTDGPVRSSPVVAGETLYVGSSDGHLYALDRSTGEAVWSVDAGSPVSSTPAVAEGLVVFVSRDGICHAVGSADGDLRWSFETGPVMEWAWGMEGWDAYVSSPVVSGGVVVFGAGDGSVYALDLATGRERWRHGTGGRVRSTPAVAGDVVFAGSADGVVYALSLDDGAEIWRHETEGVTLDSGSFGFDRRSIIASPAVVDGTVYVGSRDGFMYAIDQSTGARKWRVSHDVSWAMSSPSIEGSDLFSGTSDGLFVHRVDVTTGEEVWRFTAEGYTWSSPALAGSTLYIGDAGGYLRALDPETGEERWSIRTGAGVLSSPWVEDGAVYFGADDGVVYAVSSEVRPGHRAVYRDDALPPFVPFPDAHTGSFFALHGYEALDGSSLAGFLEARVADGSRSVIVFAGDRLPEDVAIPSDTALVRRYLESGGKVVWLGLPPASVGRNDEGSVVFDRDRSRRLLDVDFAEANGDSYGSTPTELGHGWGLERGWVSSWSVRTQDGIEVLALDENGRAGAWVKGYGGPIGTGFVGMGLPSVTPDVLEAVLAVAEFGLDRVP